MRVGLSIIFFVRRQLIQCRSGEAALALSFVCSVKLKDDGLNKQRVKMEAQVKGKTQQQPRPGNKAVSILLPT